MINIAICDDDEYFCKSLEELIYEYKSYYGVKGEVEYFTSGEKLLEHVENQTKFDLIFLDIELGTTTGIKVGAKIRKEFDDHISKIVFVTSKEGYATKLFDVQPLNYIKKSIDFDKEKLFEIIDLASKLLHLEKGIFNYKVSHEHKSIRFNEILYFVKEGRKIKIVTTTKTDYFNSSLEKVISMCPKIFVVPHSSFIVNWEKVKYVDNKCLIMENNDQIHISQNREKVIRDMLVNFDKEVSDDIL